MGNPSCAFLVSISKVTSLTKLSLTNLIEMAPNEEEEDEDNLPIIDFSQLSSLTNLVSLTLDKVHMYGEVSINGCSLWRHLVNLKHLRLVKMPFCDPDLRDIKDLTSLESLVLKNVYW